MDKKNNVVEEHVVGMICSEVAWRWRAGVGGREEGRNACPACGLSKGWEYIGRGQSTRTGTDDAPPFWLYSVWTGSSCTLFRLVLGEKTG